VRSHDSSLAWEAFRHYDDAAGRRFDEALATMPLTALQRRELRFWHRQAMDALRLYAARALPAALSNVDSAQQEVDELVARASASWQRAATAATAPPETATVVTTAPTPAPAQPHQPDRAPDGTAPKPTRAASAGTVDVTAAAADKPDALEIRRRALAARLAAGS